LIIVLLLAYLYSLLNLTIGLIQLVKKSIPLSNAVLFIIGSISILLTIFIKAPTSFLIFLIAGLALIQIGAILNGIYLKGKITISHQLTRLLFGITLVILYQTFR